MSTCHCDGPAHEYDPKWCVTTKALRSVTLPVAGKSSRLSDEHLIGIARRNDLTGLGQTSIADALEERGAEVKRLTELLMKTQKELRKWEHMEDLEDPEYD